MFRFLHARKSYMAVGAALLVWMLSAVDTTFAQVTLERLVTLPDAGATPDGVPTTAPVAPVAPALPAVSSNPILIDFSGVASVSAKSIALVSLVARQVELAKTPAGAKKVAKVLVAEKYTWNLHQVGCLTALWNSESHWNFQARNKRTGAHGIPQALPASKMESVGMDWRTNPVTQIKWGLNYIKVRYGTPCGALAKKNWSGYY
ncbi:MAG: transglycosylase SLT domain-containing protein [Actinomycetes bacterium]